MDWRKCWSGLRSGRVGSRVVWESSWAGLDAALGGGLSWGGVTEVAGEAGSGKTQLCLQLTASALLPSWLGGAESGVAYVDTEGCFNPGRLAEIYAGSLALVGEEVGSTLDEERRGKMLEGVLYRRVDGWRELGVSVAWLRGALRSGSVGRVGLVVVDSLAMPFVGVGVGDWTELRRRVWDVYSVLGDIATEQKAAVVVVNQVRSDMRGGVTPCLGPAFAAWPATRLLLARPSPNSARRTASLIKAPCQPPVSFSYIIRTLRDSRYSFLVRPNTLPL